MLNKLKNSISIPVWALSLIITIVIAIFGWSMERSYKISRVETEVVTVSKTVDELKLEDIRLQAEKADKATMEEIREYLIRIENKFDTHIAK